MSTKELIINISKDFSVYPGGRHKSDGPYSGEAFRDDTIIPALNKYSRIEINFDGARGYASSFLEECFGGLVRKGQIKSIDQFNQAFALISEEDPFLVELINEYVEDALAVKK